MKQIVSVPPKFTPTKMIISSFAQQNTLNRTIFNFWLMVDKPSHMRAASQSGICHALHIRFEARFLD